MNFTAANVSFYVQSDLVVVGSNPENADMSNPRGEILGDAIYVVAANAFGDTRLFPVGVQTDGDGLEAKADRLALALTARAKSGRLPVAFASWAEGRAVYGSDAYVAYGQDEDVACERAEG